MAWILCAIRKVSLRVARGVLAGVGRGGDWVCRHLGGGGIEAPAFPTLRCCGGIGASPFPILRCCGGIWPPAFPTLRCCGGLGLRHSPPSAVAGDWGSAIPHPPRRRGPCNNWKKAHRAPSGALCFFVHRPSLMQASLQRSAGYKKSPQALLESFFPLLR